MYLNVEEIETALVNLAAEHPSLCQLITLPQQTVEMRTSHALRLGGGPAGSRDCMVIIGGQHAREWGSSDICINFCADLLEAYAGGMDLTYGAKTYTAAQIQSLLDTLHIIVFANVNPDGRAFSMAHDSEGGTGGWRRNRNPAMSGGDPACIGVDLNRNYDCLFDVTTQFAAIPEVLSRTSPDPCNADQVYHGPSAFSEAETRNVKWLLDTNPRTRWFMDIHSYTGDILYSWGDDESQTTDPGMNFRSTAFDGLRGIAGDAAYKEFIPSGDLAIGQLLAQRFRDSLQAVRGKTYAAITSFNLYPTSGTSTDYAYSRHFVDPSKSKVHGFAIEWGTEFRPLFPEMGEIIKDVTAGLIGMLLDAPCGGGIIAITLNTPSITFNDVPAGVTTTRAAVFAVQTCSAVTFTVTDGPRVTSGPGAFNLELAPPALGAASSDIEREVRAWISFTGTSPLDVTAGTMTIHCTQTGTDYVIPILANTIEQPKIAAVMVLDKSASMGWASGIPSKTRMDVLHAAAPNFVELLPDADGVGVVAFDHNAYPAAPVQDGAAGRTAANMAITNHMTNPAGSTAIGDGVELAHNTLDPLAGYQHKAIVVFTDGEETAAKYIDDVASLINERVFAIGLGTVQEVDPVALNKLVNNTGGYLLMTDALGPNDTFRLAKYFVQILAGVTNAEIVVDPEGILPPGIEARIPFDLNENDYGSDAIVLSPAPGAFRFELETPDGARIDPALTGVVGAKFVTGAQVSFYRLSLPVVVKGNGAHRGRWHVVLKVDDAGWKKYLEDLRRHDQPAGGPGGAGSAGLGVPYSVIVHARSNLAMAAYLTQPSHEPGTILRLRATLNEIGLPVEKRADVRADVRRPDGTQITLAMPEIEPGVFEATTPAALNGIYPVRFRATGKTLRGYPFTREQLRTGMTWRGGDDPPPHGDPPPPNETWCCRILRRLCEWRATPSQPGRIN
jgi:murein tripeptide amidase MpaA